MLRMKAISDAQLKQMTDAEITELEKKYDRLDTNSLMVAGLSFAVVFVGSKLFLDFLPDAPEYVGLPGTLLIVLLGILLGIAGVFATVYHVLYSHFCWDQGRRLYMLKSNAMGGEYKPSVNMLKMESLPDERLKQMTDAEITDLAARYDRWNMIGLSGACLLVAVVFIGAEIFSDFLPDAPGYVDLPAILLGVAGIFAAAHLVSYSNFCWNQERRLCMIKSNVMEWEYQPAVCMLKMESISDERLKQMANAEITDLAARYNRWNMLSLTGAMFLLVALVVGSKHFMGFLFDAPIYIGLPGILLGAAGVFAAIYLVSYSNFCWNERTRLHMLKSNAIAADLE